MTDVTETKKAKPGRKSRAEQEAAMTQSPAFQAAVAAAVEQAIGPMLAQLGTARAAAGTAPHPGDKNMMQELALAISELTTQGTGKVRVAPEVMVQRAQARERMVNLIIAARAEKKVVTYQLRNKVVINERLIEPFFSNSAHQAVPTEIDFWGIPNDAMVPVSPAAKEIFAAFKDSVGTVQGVKGVESGLPGDDQLALTRGGLVVRNGAVSQTMAARQMPERPAWEGPMPAYEEAPQTHGEPNYEPLRVSSDGQKGKLTAVNILGTIAPAAQQTV